MALRRIFLEIACRYRKGVNLIRNDGTGQTVIVAIEGTGNGASEIKDNH